ncbi:MAG: acyl--CoA ligase [Elusimicrobia bacterium]|jgi:fatty-acyl-CoA synthase|nr:acyl--CoA ligase [Elusimicrobiota bacterium]MBK7545620.1 acyl--CoA ligase [Elusimicrobiota bacterium]MBK7575190.1 acyl--CoA ligase [Elusimicrobiota bacterium]MBK7687831.1 acyl--CoA ligase [Elusimicrobiota bacterium]MBK9057667.1 acyl--CoA ligase [Elusimicrobiota bacterium]
MNPREWLWQKSVLFLLRRYPLPRDIIRRAFRSFGPRTALVSSRGVLTFDELADRVRRWCGLLAEWGVGPSSRVFVQLKDDGEFIEIDLALYLTGAVVTFFHEATPPAFVAGAARVFHPVLFLHDPATGSAAAEALAAVDSAARRVPVDAALRARVDAAPALDPTPALRPEDICGMGFTSGTSGLPKCLPVAQGSPVRSLRLLIPHLKISAARPGTLLSGIPLIGAGSGLIFPWLTTGGCLALCPQHDIDSVVATIRQTKATRLFLTPSQLIDLLDLPPERLDFMVRVVQIIYGTAPMPAAKLEEAVRRFGPLFQQGYGMAEVLPPVTFLPMEDHARGGRPAPRSVLSSVGRVVKGVEVKIKDENGRPLPVGDTGLVWVKSPTLFTGYWDREDLNARVLVDGFLRTGDYGFFDDEGYLHILDREQDVIDRHGQKLFPRVVEETAHDHPAVKEAAFVLNKNTGRLTLVLSLRRGFREQPRAPLARDILEFVRSRVAAWQRPEDARVLDELPRSFLAKMLRRDVREFVEKNPDIGP